MADRVEPRLRRRRARADRRARRRSCRRGRSVRCRPRNESARSIVSSGASNGVASPCALGDEPRPVAPAGREPPRPRRRRSRAHAMSARAAAALATIDDDGLAERVPLRQPRQRRRVEAHRRAPVDDDRDARSLVGGAVADDELVSAGRRGEPRRREPVDRRDRIARLVRPRADHVAARPPAPARQVAERQPGQAAARNEREGAPLANATRLSASQSGAGGGASSRQRSRIVPQRLLAPEPARLGEERGGRGRAGGRAPAGTAARRPPARRGRGRAAAPTRARCARASGCRARTRRSRRPRPARVARTSSTVQRRSSSSTYTSSTARCSASSSSAVTTGSSASIGWPCRCARTIETSSSSCRVAEAGTEREPVELRLRERERPLLVDRVLGREHEERRRQRARDAVDRHLPLRHRLEQRRLRPRHRAVDLVDEHDVREDGPGAELELARLLVEDREPGDVGRLEIRACTGAARRPRPRSSARARGRGSSSPSRARPRAERARRRRARRARGAISSCLPMTTRSTFASRR